jgi:hypothetical protein
MRLFPHYTNDETYSAFAFNEDDLKGRVSMRLIFNPFSK